MTIYLIAGKHWIMKYDNQVFQYCTATKTISPSYGYFKSIWDFAQSLGTDEIEITNTGRTIYWK